MTAVVGLTAEAAFDHARTVVERSGTSFAMGMKVLPAPRRDGMFAIYAFCREVDDIADEPGAVDDKLRQLDGWRHEVDLVFQGAPTTKTGVALTETVGRFNPPQAEFVAMIDGMEMDARESMVGADWAKLDLYCRRVAGAVGLMSLPVFGTGGPVAERFAVTLGRALQLTNILRDVQEDAQRGRLYLPRESLVSAGLDPLAPDDALRRPELAVVCRTVAAEARATFDAADRLLNRIDRKAFRPALLMMGVYDALLRRLTKQDVWPAPGGLGKTGKLWGALRLGLCRR